MKKLNQKTLRITCYLIMVCLLSVLLCSKAVQAQTWSPKGFTTVEVLKKGTKTAPSKSTNHPALVNGQRIQKPTANAGKWGYATTKNNYQRIKQEIAKGSEEKVRIRAFSTDAAGTKHYFEVNSDGAVRDIKFATQEEKNAYQGYLIAPGEWNRWEKEDAVISLKMSLGDIASLKDSEQLKAAGQEASRLIAGTLMIPNDTKEKFQKMFTSSNEADIRNAARKLDLYLKLHNKDINPLMDDKKRFDLLTKWKQSGDLARLMITKMHDGNHHYLTLSFKDNTVTPDISPEFAKLADNEIVRLIITTTKPIDGHTGPLDGSGQGQWSHHIMRKSKMDELQKRLLE